MSCWGDTDDPIMFTRSPPAPRGMRGQPFCTTCGQRIALGGSGGIKKGSTAAGTNPQTRSGLRSYGASAGLSDYMANRAARGSKDFRWDKDTVPGVTINPFGEAWHRLEREGVVRKYRPSG